VRREIEPAHGATIVDLQKTTKQLAFAAARTTAAKPARSEHARAGWASDLYFAVRDEAPSISFICGRYERLSLSFRAGLQDAFGSQCLVHERACHAPASKS